MDVNTMVFALALGNLALCALLFFHDYERRRSSALSSWTIAKQLQAAAWLALTLRAAGVLVDSIALPAGYALLFAGVALEAGALWEAAGHLAWRRVMLPLLALAVALFLVCYLIDPLGLRTVASSLLLGAFYLSGAAALARDWNGASMLRRFLAIAIALLALLVAARGALVLVMPAGWGWISNTLLQALSSTAFFLLMVFNGFGCLLLVRERLQRTLERLEVVDALTDVPNRRGFFNALGPWMALARRPGLPTALLMLDLDNFKRVNDSYGHPAGDTVLRAVVEVCQKQLRDSDQLGRLMGVEFAILLPRTGLNEALVVAERIRAAIEATPVKSERAMIKLTASFGVTTIRADDTTVSLFQRADQALLAAKLAGHNRVVEAPAPPTPEL
jgi:diguanylate cyclase (GGDEF)-like protein